MAWNRSSDDGRARTPAAPRRIRSVRPTIAVIVGLIVVGAAVTAWWLWPEPKRGEDAASTTSTSLIREAKPAAAPKYVGNAKSGHPLTYEEKKAAALASNALARANAPKGPKARLVLRKPKPDDIKWLFKNVADREIQCLLDIKPGEVLFAPSDYSHFDKQFEKAIKEPIELDPSDTPEEREVRKAVIEIREELKARKARGEDLREVMLAAQKELIEMGEYKDELEHQIREIRRNREKHSPADVIDAINAANIMLREKGILEMQCPALWKYQAERYLRQKVEKDKNENEVKHE